MISYLVLQKELSYKEYDLVKTFFCDKKSPKDHSPIRYMGAKSGIYSFNLWMSNPDKNGYTHRTLNATILSGSKFVDHEPVDITDMIDMIDSILKQNFITLTDSEWRIQKINFKVLIRTVDSEMYIKLLSKAEPSVISNLKKSKGYKVTRIIDDYDPSKIETIKESEGYDFSNDLMSVHFKKSDNKHVEMDIEIDGKYGMRRMAKEIGVDNRNISSYDGKMDKVEKFFVVDALKSITGVGDYYGIKEAERVIDGYTDITNKEKNKYVVVLNGISRSRGIDYFLSNIDKGKISSEDMRLIKNRKIAERMIDGLIKHKINPVTITSRDENLGYKMLPNLLNCIWIY